MNELNLKVNENDSDFCELLVTTNSTTMIATSASGKMFDRPIDATIDRNVYKMHTSNLPIEYNIHLQNSRGSQPTLHIHILSFYRSNTECL